jgi:hypothetical protein
MRMALGCGRRAGQEAGEVCEASHRPTPCHDPDRFAADEWVGRVGTSLVDPFLANSKRELRGMSPQVTSHRSLVAGHSGALEAGQS